MRFFFNGRGKFPPAFFLSMFSTIIGFAAGFFVSDMINKGDDKASAMIEKREGGHRFVFINPLLECDSSEKYLRTKEIRPFKNIVEEYIENGIDKKHVDMLSVYFRELNDGFWFSIEGKQRYEPASMRKVPLMIALLKHAEKDKSFLQSKIKFDLVNDYDSVQNYRPSQALVQGQTYTVDELIRRMLVYSDNNSFMLLAGIVNPTDLNDVYYLLDMKSPDDHSKGKDFHTVFTYASFFRILYNSSFLEREMSEKALSYLSNSEFELGIAAGMPPDIVVANKFGEFSDDPKNIKQLHDCGIIYFPKHPYLLCIMSRGDDFGALQTTLSSVSNIIYTQLEEQHKTHHHTD